MYSTSEFSDYHQQLPPARGGQTGRYRRPRRAHRDNGSSGYENQRHQQQLYEDDHDHHQYNNYYEDGELNGPPGDRHHQPRPSQGGASRATGGAVGSSHDPPPTSRTTPGTHDWRYGRPRRRHVPNNADAEWGGEYDDDVMSVPVTRGMSSRGGRGPPRGGQGGVYDQRSGGAKRGRGGGGGRGGGMGSNSS
eukprot:Lankesteria_metandrocarpae@DN1847_c0_g1_i2.p1